MRAKKKKQFFVRKEFDLYLGDFKEIAFYNVEEQSNNVENKENG